MGKIKATDIQDLGLAITCLGCMRSQVQILSRRPLKYLENTKELAKPVQSPVAPYYLILSQFISIWLEAIRGKLGVGMDLLVRFAHRFPVALPTANRRLFSNPTTPSITKSITASRGLDYGQAFH